MPKLLRFFTFLGVLILLVARLEGVVFADAEPEKLTITTYYPIPSGTYNKLTTTGNTYLATNNVGVGTTPPGLGIGLGVGVTLPPRTLLQVGPSPSAGVINGLIVTSAGNVGIGTTASADYRLYVDGNVFVKGNMLSTGGINPQIGFNGQMNIWGQGGVCTITVTYGVITVSNCLEVG